MDAFAARVMGWLLLLLGTMMTALAALELALRSQPQGPWRLVLGVAVLLVGALSWVLRLAGRPRLASLGALLGVSVVAGVFGAVSGQGIHAFVLAGASVLIVLAGVLISARAALGVAALQVAVLSALYLAEQQGLIPGLAAWLERSPASRGLAHAMLIATALTSAIVASRMFARSLQRALEQERRLGELLRIGSDWSWEMSRRGRITAISPSFKSGTGREVAEFMRLGRPGGPQVVPDAEFERLNDDMRALRPYRNRVITMRCVDGTLLCVSGSGEPVFDAAGRHSGWWGVSRNVTAERLAQQALNRSQAMLDRLVRLSPDAICVARLRDGRILLANPAFRQLSGLAEAAIVGRSALELGLWRDPEAPHRLVQALADGQGQVRNLRSIAWTADGQMREVLLTAAAFEWDAEPVAVITTRDITETERARREGDAILDNASVGIALVREMHFQRVNPVFERMVGCAPGTLAGRHAATLFRDGASFERFVAQASAALEQPGGVDIERQLPHPDGSVHAVHLRARPVQPGQARASGSIWVAEDVTERRRIQSELAQAKQQAEAANQAKSAFLATMSHEIRTPLGAVAGLARLLQEPGLDEARRREYLAHLLEAAELLTGTVGDVLDLSKIEAGHLQLEAIGFDLAALAASVFHSFAPLGRERGLQMLCTLDPDLPRRVRGDPVRLRQILANYLSNALKFTQRGSIELRLCCSAPDRVRLAVRDTGPGVGAELRQRLFRPFVQADSSTTRRFGGTGLGLSICRELARRMDGDADVESDGVSGSEFWAELRLPPDHDGAEPAAAQHGEHPLAGMCVLVAEDNPVNMLIVSAMLQRLGATALEAHDGEQAVALALAPPQPLHAVLMDLHMPRLDGLAAARRLQADARTARLPVLALSAAVLAREREAALEAGMRNFLGKPVDQDELLEALRPWAPGASDNLGPAPAASAAPELQTLR